MVAMKGLGKMVAAGAVVVLGTGCVSASKYRMLEEQYKTDTGAMSQTRLSLEKRNNELELMLQGKGLELQQVQGELERWKLEHQLMRQQLEQIKSLEDLGATVEGNRARFDEDLLFDPGSANVKSGTIPVLDKLVQILQKDPSYVIQIDGHTDNQPIKASAGVWKTQSNFELGAHRALNVLMYVQKGGIPGDRLWLATYGENRPIDPQADNNAGPQRKKNRRVEVWFYKR